MWLLVDDFRSLSYVDVIARTYEAGKKMVVVGGWDCIVFDHDLGEGKTGYDLLVWGLENDFIKCDVQLISSNPPGKENMRRALLAHGYSEIKMCYFEITE